MRRVLYIIVLVVICISGTTWLLITNNPSMEKAPEDTKTDIDDSNQSDGDLKEQSAQQTTAEESDSSSMVSIANFNNLISKRLPNTTSNNPIPSNDDNSQEIPVPQPKVWLPEGRFMSSVFEPGDIETETIDYGTITNFSGAPETLRMTINSPSGLVDPEHSRPVIIAMTGGDTIGFCDSTLVAEQEAMLELTQLGYVTVTLTPLLDSNFCSGPNYSEYLQNMAINLEAADEAISYLYNNADIYSIDPTKTALYGYSIGGQTALLKLRQGRNEGPNVKLIASFAAIAQDSPLFNIPFGNLMSADNEAPKVFMLSFEPDVGYGLDINPDARADCDNLVTLGYNCTFQGIPVPGHAVHANTRVDCGFLAMMSLDCFDLGLPVTDNFLSVPALFQPYLYNTLIL